MLLLLAGCNIDQVFNPNVDGAGADDDTGSSTSDLDTGPVFNALGEACNGEDDDGDGAVDEGWPDADANGRADCLDASCPPLNFGEAGAVSLAAACLVEGADPGLPIEDPWDAAIQWQFEAPAANRDATWSFSQPVVGNLDDDNGDGVIDEDDSPEVVASLVDRVTLTEAWIVAIDGATGIEQWSWEGALPTGGVIIADVNADGAPDVVGFNEHAEPVALDGRGRLQWTGEATPTSPDYPLLSAADLDNDGMPEVIADDVVLSGYDGSIRFILNVPIEAPYRMAAVADVDLDGDQEIAMAGALYDSDGALLWESGETGPYGFWPIIVQADADAAAEIGFVGTQWTLWEADGRGIYRRGYGPMAQPGPPCAGDFDGDGEAEVAWPAYESLVMYELDGSEVWSTPIEDLSGLAGCSGYDVDGDGALEVLFADEVSFKILDGRTGSVKFINASHRSGTVFEYPTVADIDHDDHAEIVIASNSYSGSWGAVTAFEHGGDGWPAAGSTWGLHDFAITNINADGSIPATPEPSWLAYNVYRARVAADTRAPPDLMAEITDVCIADCALGPVRVAVQVANRGGANVTAGVWLSLYADDGDALRWIGRWALPALPARQKLAGMEIPVGPADIGRNGFVVAVDDNGAGAGVIAECAENDNTDPWTDISCP